jgi:hypothetical protein
MDNSAAEKTEEVMGAGTGRKMMGRIYAAGYC